ncbi:hypothetical protein H0A36_16700 [Endozoicomonas sp. SM1973]|uniref:Type II secretion system protein GspC N-terminal domain-containing protein n=1 Tax=Spartinivicinus marinus TaxID=2994442 RepID=A0A853I2P0_9GAMM|nr:type II secretion system protein N [Spartinivicinus marinus]MCX4024961.1 hypothetical protein [Spartinivicinus marinus]NYZ67653.1 hypothetical protein [Spartinivicinus marinus]
MNSTALSPYLTLGHKKNISAFCLIVLVLIGMTLATKGMQLYQALTAPKPQVEAIRDVAQTKPRSQYNAQSIALLFGKGVSEQPVAQKHIPKTNLRLVLKGAFANQNDRLSSAIIEGSNRQAILYQVGDTLPGQATLHKVKKDHVIISRNGVLETLYFPEANSPNRIEEYKGPHQLPKPPEPVSVTSPEPLENASAQQRMKELQARMKQLDKGAGGG